MGGGGMPPGMMGMGMGMGGMSGMDGGDVDYSLYVINGRPPADPDCKRRRTRKKEIRRRAQKARTETA